MTDKTVEAVAWISRDNVVGHTCVRAHVAEQGVDLPDGTLLYTAEAIQAAVNAKLEAAAYKCENMADKIGDMNTYNNSCESCCDNSAMRMAYDCAEAIRALMESPQPTVPSPTNESP